MRVLLDTHVWLWAAGSPDLLSSPVRTVLEDSDNERFLSPISVWEFLLLAQKGRIQVHGDPAARAREIIALQNLTVLPVSLDIAVETGKLDGFDRQDPGDRFIIATARVHNLCLLTADAWILRWPGVKSLW